MTDERLREVAKKHARDACNPINALDQVSMQEQLRCEEIIFYALKEAFAYRSGSTTQACPECGDTQPPRPCGAANCPYTADRCAE